jgi:hypothetical protein
MPRAYSPKEVAEIFQYFDSRENAGPVVGDSTEGNEVKRRGAGGDSAPRRKLEPSHVDSYDSIAFRKG